MTSSCDLIRLFRENFPAAIREEYDVQDVLANPDRTVFTHYEENRLVGAAVVGGDTIYMLAVDRAYRGQGIGSRLLAQAEDHVRAHGYDRIHFGDGDNYLTPGVPVRTDPHEHAAFPEQLHPSLTDDAWQFLKSRGYTHSWGDCSCFDMSMDLADFPPYSHEIGDTLQGFHYRWAVLSDLPGILACTDAAEEGFTDLYRSDTLYDPQSPHRVLLAEENGRICGVLQVLFGVEDPQYGSIGCTAVHPDYQGRHIASTLVMLATKALKEAGYPFGFLGYTYSGLEYLYGKAGFRISCYYAMAEKSLAD